jgi:hypothetical protein
MSGNGAGGGIRKVLRSSIPLICIALDGGWRGLEFGCIFPRPGMEKGSWGKLFILPSEVG